MYNIFDTDINLDLYREQYKIIFNNDNCFSDFADKLESKLNYENNTYKMYLKDKLSFSYYL